EITAFFLLAVAPSSSTLAQKDNVLQPEGDETQTEGDTVTLDCLYNSSSTNYYLFWYKQDGNNRPRFILSRFKIGQGKTENEFKERFSSTLNSTFRSIPLKIQKLHVSDSAVYYCALHERFPSTRGTHYPVGGALLVHCVQPFCQ
uniref:Ig-like domain-containing protein n=1 Tax=Anabas testudineus TaxID=64144 RepID=A0A3Q1HMD2_ANATE